MRAFAIDNALYWLKEFHLDGLASGCGSRDARDDLRNFTCSMSSRAATVRARITDRPVQLVLGERRENEAHRLIRGRGQGVMSYTAQWNDDVHHVLHTAATKEGNGYYADYVGDTHKLARALAEGFAFQGELMSFRGSQAWRSRAPHLPPGAFVAFIQNHDQVGNRAFGERLTAADIAAGAQGHRGNVSAAAAGADAVHGGRVGRSRTVSVLL